MEATARKQRYLSRHLSEEDVTTPYIASTMRPISFGERGGEEEPRLECHGQRSRLLCHLVRVKRTGRDWALDHERSCC